MSIFTLLASLALVSGIVIEPVPVQHEISRVEFNVLVRSADALRAKGLDVSAYEAIVQTDKGEIVVLLTPWTMPVGRYGQPMQGPPVLEYIYDAESLDLIRERLPR